MGLNLLTLRAVAHVALDLNTVEQREHLGLKHVRMLRIGAENVSLRAWKVEHLSAVYPTDANTSLQAAIRDKLADKIKTGFVELIPQEAFNGLLDAAVDEFLRGPRKHRSRTQHQYLSKDDARNTTGEPGYCTFEEPFTDPNYNVFADKNTLPGMIYLELVAIAQKAVPEGIAKDERFQQTWDADVQTMVVPILDKIVQDNAQAFMRAMIGGIVQHTMVQSINNMRNGNNMAPYCPPPPGL
jgi:hypothetical protein